MRWRRRATRRMMRFRRCSASLWGSTARMEIDRRDILRGLAAALAASLVPGRAMAKRPALYISCRMDAEGKASAALFSLEGEELFSTVLPSRGHDATARPASPEIVVFARRPGNWFIVIDAATGRLAG